MKFGKCVRHVGICVREVEKCVREVEKCFRDYEMSFRDFKMAVREAETSFRDFEWSFRDFKRAFVTSKKPSSSWVWQLTNNEKPSVKVRATVEGREGLPAEVKLDERNRPLRRAFVPDDAINARIFENRRVQLHGLLGLVVERQVRGDFLHGLCFLVTDQK